MYRTNYVGFRSFQSTFYVRNSLVGNFSASNYYVIYIEDERFFFNETTFDRQLWHTTRTYLIVSENKLIIPNIWSQIKRLWEKFKVFKISLLHSHNLRVLRIFDEKFYRYVPARKLNYGTENVKKYPLRVAIFERMPSIVCMDGVCTGPDWKTMQSFVKRMNFDLRINMVSDDAGFGRFVLVFLTKLFGRIDEGLKYQLS